MKAMLIVEMPKNCGSCKLCSNALGSHWCTYLDVEVLSSHIFEKCPLRYLPNEKYHDAKDTSGWNDYVGGWNDCLSEIKGE